MLHASSTAVSCCKREPHSSARCLGSKQCSWLVLLQVWRHRVGGNAEQDELVYHEQDDQFYVGLGKSRDDKILSIRVGTGHAMPLL